jgi:hypothetical protein
MPVAEMDKMLGGNIASVGAVYVYARKLNVDVIRYRADEHYPSAGSMNAQAEVISVASENQEATVVGIVSDAKRIN